MTPDLEQGKHDAHAIFHGALALFNAAVLLAVVAVILSSRSGTPQIITSAFKFLSWLVEQAIKPVTGGRVVNLSATPSIAGTDGVTQASPSSTTGSTGSTGSTPGLTGANGQSTYGDVWGYGDFTDASVNISASNPGVTSGTGIVTH